MGEFDEFNKANAEYIKKLNEISEDALRLKPMTVKGLNSVPQGTIIPGKVYTTLDLGIGYATEDAYASYGMSLNRDNYYYTVKNGGGIIRNYPNEVIFKAQVFTDFYLKLAKLI